MERTQRNPSLCQKSLGQVHPPSAAHSQHYMSTIISITQMTGHVPSAFLTEDGDLGVSLLFSMKLHKSTQVETSVRDTACKVSHGRDMGHVAHAWSWASILHNWAEFGSSPRDLRN